MDEFSTHLRRAILFKIPHNLRSTNAAFSPSAHWTGGTGTSIYSRSEAQADEAFRCGRSSKVLAIGFVAAVLFVAVEKIEPNRPYAYLLMFLILAVGMLAIVELVP